MVLGLAEQAAAIHIPDMANAASKVTNLSKQFGDIVAVDDLTFEIEEGSLAALLGGNGDLFDVAGADLCPGLRTTEGPLSELSLASCAVEVQLSRVTLHIAAPQKLSSARAQGPKRQG